MSVETKPQTIPPAEAPLRDFIFFDPEMRSGAIRWAVEVAMDGSASNASMKRAGKILIANSTDRTDAGHMLLALAVANERLDALEKQVSPVRDFAPDDDAINEWIRSPAPLAYESRLHLAEAISDMKAQSSVARLNNPIFLGVVGVLAALALAMIVAPAQMAELIVQATTAIRARF